MSIFKKAKKSIKLMGANMPSWVHAYFAIYCVAKGMYRSDLIRQIFERFIEEQREKETEEDLINQILLRCKRAYKAKPLKHDMDLDQFREEVTADLRIKGVPEGYIKIVIRRLTFD